MTRRRMLLAGGAGLGLLTVGGGVWLGGASPPVTRLPDLAHARRWIALLATEPGARSIAGWPLAQVLEHAAQSVEYSLDGYPAGKSAWFQASAGALAFAAFDRSGAMRHGLDEPIPGAPPLEEPSVVVAAERLLTALERFERHPGALAPHFAFGALEKPQYQRAHLMHLADHAQRIVPAPA